MVKRASWLKTALYVKCCSVSLMHAYGGCWDRHESLPHPISLARLERPRVIRNFHRRLIRRHDVRADGLVKMYLSMFSVSKLILVPKQSNYQYPQKIIRVGRLFGLGRLKVGSFTGALSLYCLCSANSFCLRPSILARSQVMRIGLRVSPLWRLQSYLRIPLIMNGKVISEAVGAASSDGATSARVRKARNLSNRL